MIEDAEAEGAIAPGQTILEPTSGNTGIALAMICRRKGYPLKVVMPDNVTEERTQLLTMYGAEIVYSRGRQGLQRRRRDGARAWPRRPRLTTCPTSTATRPTRSPTTTAPRSRSSKSSTRSPPSSRGLGTGGTLMGNGRRLKEDDPETQIVAAEPMQGELVQGLRSLDDGFIPPIIDLSPARPQDHRLQPRRDRLDEEAARRGGHLRRRLRRRDRRDRRPHRRRARRAATSSS